MAHENNFGAMLAAGALFGGLISLLAGLGTIARCSDENAQVLTERLKKSSEKPEQYIEMYRRSTQTYLSSAMAFALGGALLGCAAGYGIKISEKEKESKKIRGKISELP